MSLGCLNGCSGFACVENSYCNCPYLSKGGYDCSAECSPGCKGGYCDYQTSGDNASGAACICPYTSMGDLCEYGTAILAITLP